MPATRTAPLGPGAHVLPSPLASTPQHSTSASSKRSAQPSGWVTHEPIPRRTATAKLPLHPRQCGAMPSARRHRAYDSRDPYNKMPVEAVFSASVRRITTLARVAESIQVSQGRTEHLGREHRGTFSVAGAASWRGGERHDRLAWGEMTPGSSTNSVVESFTIWS